MSLNVYMWNDINVDKIKFGTRPYKKVKTIAINGESLVKTVYYIDIFYNKTGLYIQFPKSDLVGWSKAKCQAQFEISQDIVQTFILPLHEHIINIVHKHSEDWFQGKRFTKNKISKCMLSSITEESPEVSVINATISKDIKLFDETKNEIDDSLISKCENVKCIALVKLANLQFIDNRFTYNFCIEQMKVFQCQPILNYSILDDSSSGSDTVPSHDDEYYRNSEEIDGTLKHFF